MLLPLILSLTAPSEITLGARLEAEGDALEPGGRYEVVLDLELPAGTANADSKIAPFLQIDPPAGVVLEGRVLTEYADLARNEFLQAPFERALDELPARIAFRLEGTPAEGATLGLSVIAYLVDEAGEHSFLRRRLELPLEPGARAREGDASNSSWGANGELLQIGQRAADFELPRADGSPVALTDYIGDRNIIVTTYRAYW